MKPPPLILNPWVGFIGTICGIIGLPLSVILFFYAVKVPHLTYAVYPRQTTSTLFIWACCWIARFTQQ